MTTPTQGRGLTTRDPFESGRFPLKPYRRLLATLGITDAESWLANWRTSRFSLSCFQAVTPAAQA